LKIAAVVGLAMLMFSLVTVVQAPDPIKKGMSLGGGWLKSGAEFIACGRYFGSDVEATGMVKYVAPDIKIESINVSSSGIEDKMGVLKGYAIVNGPDSYAYEVRMGKGWFNISVPAISYSSNSTLKNGTITISDGNIIYTTSKSG